jgi:outer membrane protein assembly factor BamB
MKKLLYRSLLSALAFTLVSCHHESSNQYLSSFHYPGPPLDNKVMWQEVVEGKITTTPIMAQLWTPIIHNGQETKMKQNELFMLFGNSIGKLYNFDYKKGHFKWINPYNISITSSPINYNGKVHFGLINGTLIQVDVNTGQEYWRVKLDGKILSDSQVDEEHIYIGTDKGVFYCIEKETGKIKWLQSIKGQIISSSVVYNNMVYFGSTDSNFYALQKDTGEIKWTFKTGDSIRTIPIASQNKVYFISDDKKLYCLDHENGNVVWSYILPSKTKSSPSLNSNRGMIYVVSDKKLLYIDLKTGERIKNGETFKETSLPADVETPIINIDGYIFITDTFGKVYDIDETNQQLKWQFEGVGHKTTAPFLFNGIVHYGTDEGVIYAVGRNEDVGIYAPIISRSEETLKNRTGSNQFRMLYNIASGTIPTGALRKIYTLADSVISSPAFENDFIYLGAGNKLYSLRTDSDIIRWTFDDKSNINSSPSISNRQVCFASQDGVVYTIDADDKNRVIWKYKLGSTTSSSAYISEDNTYIGDDDGYIYAINNQGNLKWKYKTSGKIKSSPVVHNKILYVGSNDKSFYAINTITGELLWEFYADSPINSIPAVVGDSIYFGTDSGKFFCLDSNTHQEKWTFKANKSIYSSPAIINNKVVFGSMDKKLYALDLNGKKIWDFSTNGEIEASPTIVDNYVYIGASDKKIYSINLDTGTKNWSVTLDFPICY